MLLYVDVLAAVCSVVHGRGFVWSEGTYIFKNSFIFCNLFNVIGKNGVRFFVWHELLFLV